MRRGRRHVFGFATVAAATLCSACSGGGGGGSPTATAPPPVVVTRSFPAGDAVAAGGGTAWDIIGVKTTLTGQFASGGGNLYDTLRVDVTFAQNIANALPLPGQPLSGLNELGISIGLDTDGNPATGNFKGCNSTGDRTPFEYDSDQGNDPSRLSDGNFAILGAGGPIYSGSPNPPAEAQTTVNGSILTESFFLPSIGVATANRVPKVGLSVAAGNGTAGGQTDCVPDDSSEVFTDGSEA